MTNVYKIKQEICRIGDRLYKRGFAAANDGNLSYRISENEVICTPTMISKGFMKPEDLVVVDMEGNQRSGRRQKTSELKLHLAILKARPDLKAVVHCHPPHATAFGVAREPVPQCVLSEVEIFIGEAPIARYAIPGSQEFAETVLPFVHKASVIILANHGTVSFDQTLEKAYWWTEMLDSYCRILMLARSLGRINYFTEPEAQALLEVKRRWGLRDPRTEMENCDICANDVFRESWKESGVRPQAFQAPRFRPEESAREASCPAESAAKSIGPSAAPGQEALIQAVTDRVMAALSRR
jgi:L-fuculose-phosphate aldolase